MELVLGGFLAIILFLLGTFIAAGAFFMLLLFLASGYHKQKQGERWEKFRLEKEKKEKKNEMMPQGNFSLFKQNWNQDKKDVENEYLFILYGKIWFFTILLLLIVWLRGAE